MEVGFSSLGTFSRTFTDVVGETPSQFRRRGPMPERAVLLREGLGPTEQFRRSFLTGRGRTVDRMYDAISRSQIFVLDQDEALDFYTNKLGLELALDLDLGFMRWLTVRVPGDPGPRDPPRAARARRPWTRPPPRRSASW